VPERLCQRRLRVTDALLCVTGLPTVWMRSELAMLLRWRVACMNTLKRQALVRRARSSGAGLSAPDARVLQQLVAAISQHADRQRLQQLQGLCKGAGSGAAMSYVGVQPR
jgi:hypothetical protein